MVWWGGRGEGAAFVVGREVMVVVVLVVARWRDLLRAAQGRRPSKERNTTAGGKPRGREGRRRQGEKGG